MKTCNFVDNLKIIESNEYEINILNELGKEYKQYSEMSDQDRSFLNTLVLRKQPLKVLELGVCSCGSSLVLLNAIKNINNAHLYSIDYNTQHYKLKDKLTGFYVDNFPELKNKWTLKTGGLALDFMEEIGGDIDFCLIDTVHSNPGEILDFLMVLPYLKKEATVVFHDTNLHAQIAEKSWVNFQYTNNLLMSTINGTKLLPANTPYRSGFEFINIGAVDLNENSFKHIWEIFNLLTLKWQYLPTGEEITQLADFIYKYYGVNYSEYFNKVFWFQKRVKQMDNTIKKEQITLEKIQSELQKIQDELEFQHSKITYWQQLFSVKNENKHKVLRLLGVKFKFRRRGV